MFRSVVGMGILTVGGLYLLYHLTPRNIEPLTEAPPPSETTKKDIDLQESISDEISAERKRVADDYWTKWNRENIITMSDKMWDYQMDRYDLYQQGKITRYRWNDAVYPPSLFY